MIQHNLIVVPGVDVQEDKAMLRRLVPLLREECLRCLEVTTTILKMCAAAGLTLFEIGSMMTRTDSLGEQLPSDLEVMCIDARAEADASVPQSSLLQPSCFSPVHSLTSGIALPPLVEEREEGIFQLEGEVSGILMPQRSSYRNTESFGRGVSEDGSSARLGSPSSPFDSPKYGAFGGPLNCRLGSLPGWCTAPPPVRYHNKRSTTSYNARYPEDQISFAESATTPVNTRTYQKHADRRKQWRTKQHARSSNRAMYPPHVSGEHPDLVNYVFRGLSEAQWGVFMAAVREWCEEELANQTWKQCVGNAAVAGSCPVFRG